MSIGPHFCECAFRNQIVGGDQPGDWAWALIACRFDTFRRNSACDWLPACTRSNLGFLRPARLTVVLDLFCYRPIGVLVFGAARVALAVQGQWLRYQRLCADSTRRRLVPSPPAIGFSALSGVSLSLACARESNQREAHPGEAPSGHPALGCLPVLAEFGPPNNSAVHGLKQFGYPPNPAPLLSASQGPR